MARSSSGRPAPPWDATVTVALLVFGVFNVTQTVAQARDLPDALQAVYSAQGIGTYTSIDVATAAGWFVIGANLLTLALAIGFSVPRIRTKRISFWVPLVCAAIAALVTGALVMAAVVGDPAFVTYMQRHS